jgi:predicted kinase
MVKYSKEEAGKINSNSKYLVIDGSIGLSMIDCIEFNRRFRTNDILSEAAFLTMEMDQYYKSTLKTDNLMLGFFGYLNQANVDEKLKGFDLGGRRILSVKNKDTGEIYYRADKSSEESYPLLNFYKCYRAMVRAKVAVLAYKNSDDEALKKAKLDEYNTLIDLAFIYSIAMLKIYSIAFCGMIGTGKTTCAARFAERFRALHCPSDKVRKIFFSDESKPSVVPTGEGSYDEQTSIEVYKMLGAITHTSATTGRLSLVDATFLNKKCLDAFESELGSVPIYIKFTADEDIIKERLAARTGGLSDGRLMHFNDLYPLSKELSTDFEIDNTSCADPMQAVIDGLINLLDVNVEPEL